MASVIGRLVAIIDGDLSGLEKALGDAQRQLGRAGRAFTDAGKALTIGITAPVVAVGALATKASIEFESAFAGVRKTVEATEAQFAELEKGIRDMAKTTPATATSIAKVAEAAGQLGVKTEAILEFSRVMVDLGNTTNLTADQAATAFAQIANVMKLPQDQFDEMGAALVDLGNKGASTEAEIIEMAKRIAGAGATIGLSTADVLGLGAALANVGIEAEAGGSAISRVMIEIAQAVANGGKKLDDFAAVAGFNARTFTQAWGHDPAMALASFIEGLGRLDEAGLNVFQTLKDLKLNEIRVRDALLRTANAGDIFRTQIQLSGEAWKENNALTAEAAKRYETTASKLAIMRNRMNDAAITLGDALVPAGMKALDAAVPLIAAIGTLAALFADLPGPVQTGILGVLALGAAMGPLLLVMGNLATGLRALIALSTLMGGPSGLIALRAPIMALGAAFLTPPLGIVIALAAVGVALYIFRDDIKKALAAAADAVAEFARKGYQFLKGPFEDALDWLKKNWKTVALLVAGPFAPIVALATDAFGVRSALENAFTAMAGFVERQAEAIGGFLAAIPSNVVAAFGMAGAAVAEAISGLVNVIAQNFNAENLGKAFGWFLLWPVYVFRQAFEAVLPLLTTFFGETLPSLFTNLAPSLAASGATLGMSAMVGVSSGMRAGWSGGLAFLTQELPAALLAATSSIAASAKSLGQSIIAGVGAGLTSSVVAVKTFFTGTLPSVITGAQAALLSTARTLGDLIVNAIGDGISGALEIIRRGPVLIRDEFVAAFNSVASSFYNIGREIVRGVWEGIQSLADWLYDQVRGFFKGLADSAKKAAGIKSPSTVMAAIGHDLMTGLSVGMVDGFRRSVMPAMARMQNQIVATASGWRRTADGGWYNPNVTSVNSYQRTPPRYVNSYQRTSSRASMPRLAGGLPFVTQAKMPALLDYGERVLTADENRAYSAGGGLQQNFNAPITVHNDHRSFDTKRVLAEVAYVSAYEYKSRGGRA